MMMLCDTTPRMGEMTGLMSSYAGSECEIGESGIGLRKKIPVPGAGDGDGSEQ